MSIIRSCLLPDSHVLEGPCLVNYSVKTVLAIQQLDGIQYQKLLVRTPCHNLIVYYEL